MSALNLPPFYVGQKVVCVKNVNPLSDSYRWSMMHGVALFVKGETYTIRDIFFDTLIKKWAVRLVEIVNPVLSYSDGTAEAAFDVCFFVAIETTFEAISFEKVIAIESQLVNAN